MEGVIIMQKDVLLKVKDPGSAMVLVLMLGFVLVEGCSISAHADATARTVIISAFGFEAGSGEWRGESGPFINALTTRTVISDRVPFCDIAFEGEINGWPVTVVTMRIGKVHAAVCMQDLLRYYEGAAGIREVIWSGVAGITPMVGGMLDVAGNRRQAETTVIGDVCISHIAVDYDLRHSAIGEKDEMWLMRLPNESRTAVGSLDLASELYTAAQRVAWPEVPAGPALNITKYHGAKAVRKARAFDGTTCAEATSDNFWHSVQEDQWARELLAQTISQTLGTRVTPDGVLAITAMEQTGWSNVLEMWTDATGEKIPFAYSRSASNYDHPWLDTNNRPAVSGAESLRAGMDAAGLEYAAITAALPILKMLQRRKLSIRH
ncbi:MAG: hypothetical protein QGI68_13005 [Pseudomonadales bacterium]|jgi:nucleoside phosphorylase|nr:hypothetical protein [Pseudomonadales bacterium]MDP7596472.1 hypothetical protein [Pseudomonadales bacterium]HJN52849.1 hypothetical protein [Pseudomonadales bacterium]